MQNGVFPRTLKIIPIVLVLAVTAALFCIQPVSAQAPVVRAVLFYSPTCGHCHKVITEDLPPLLEQYGDQLEILFVNVQEDDGGELFIAAVEYFDIPLDRAGVPFLVVEEAHMMGSAEIPERFPAIVEVGLTSGGIDWPQIPGLMDYLEEAGLLEIEGEQPDETEEVDVLSTQEEPMDETEPAADSLPTQEEPMDETEPADESQPQDEPLDESKPDLSIDDIETGPMSLKQRFLQDVAGNSVSVLVLLGMVFILVWVVLITTGRLAGRKACPAWVFIALVVVGLVVSAYMSFIELTHETAVCGPIGDCNTVQQSEYATLFGVIPVGVLGIVGYGFLAAVWFIRRWGPENLQQPAANLLFAMTFGGTLFSIYLTYLEPFVIGASCAWCLTSAIVMTALMWCSTQGMVLLKKGK